jgi:hypothetical protein
MTSRKKPGVAFWATVVVVALLAYPLSMGPAWRLSREIGLPEFAQHGVDVFYEPVWWARWNGPEWFQNAAQTYLHWWSGDQFELAPYRGVTGGLYP